MTTERAVSGAVLPVGKLPGDMLARLLSTYGTSDPSIIVGPGVGRDAAAVAWGDTTLVVKADPITFATANAARYLVNINANDLACLGAVPRWLVVTALFPEGKTTEALVESHFRQLAEECAEHHILLVGGHTEITHGLDRPILVGQLIGEATRAHLLLPGGASPGDTLLLTRSIAVEGTALLAQELRRSLIKALGAELIERASDLLNTPGLSIVRDAAVLLDAGGVTALHDPTEGGLATGVRELAVAANCGATIDLSRVPVLDETRAIAQHLRLDPLGMLASGSLLVAATPSRVDGLIAAAGEAGIAVAMIGRVTAAAQGFTMFTESGPKPLPTFVTDEVTRALAM